MAGAAGLPWEIGKTLVMAAWALGLSDDWEQYEADVQRKLQQILGDRPAEVVMQGMPRLLGINLSNRVGFDSMLLFGSPKDAKANDVKAWLFDTIAGAPGGAISDGLKGVAAAVGGEQMDAVKTLPLPKIMKDTLKAWQGWSEGKVDKKGKQLAPRLSVAEAAVKAFGIQPASEARQFEAGGSGREAKEERQTKQKRTELMSAWQMASGSARDRQWEKVRAWNASNPDYKISMSDLRRMDTRRRKENAESRREMAEQ